MDAKELIAKRVGQEFSDGDLVNLGIPLCQNSCRTGT